MDGKMKDAIELSLSSCVGLPVDHFGSDWNILTTIGYIAWNSFENINGSKKDDADWLGYEQDRCPHSFSAYVSLSFDSAAAGANTGSLKEWQLSACCKPD